MRIDNVFPIIILLLFLFVWGMGLGMIINRADYKRGQIDAINGDIRYELVTQPNGEMRWEAKR